MKVVENSKYIDDPRVKELIEWCNIHKGRTITLSRLLFNEEDGRIYPYKSGRLYLSDKVWSSIKEVMPIIEQSEPSIKIPVKGRIRHTEYNITAKIYHRALKNLNSEKSITRFGKYVGLDLNMANIKNPIYKDIILSQYDSFKKSECLTPSHMINSKDLKNIIDDWILSNGNIKKKLFNIVYSVIADIKIFGNKFSSVYNTSLVTNKSVKGYLYKNVLDTVKVIDYLIFNNDELINILLKNTLNDTIKLINLDYYKEYFKQILSTNTSLLMAAA